MRGDIELMGVPPTRENLGLVLNREKPTHTVTLVLHNQKVHLSIVSTIIFFSYTASINFFLLGLCLQANNFK